MQGGHRGSSFHTANYFYKRVPHNKTDECQGYEILTNTPVPLKQLDGQYTENAAKEEMVNLLSDAANNTPYILPV